MTSEISGPVSSKNQPKKPRIVIPIILGGSKGGNKTYGSKTGINNRRGSQPLRKRQTGSPVRQKKKLFKKKPYHKRKISETNKNGSPKDEILMEIEQVKENNLKNLDLRKIENSEADTPQELSITDRLHSNADAQIRTMRTQPQSSPKNTKIDNFRSEKKNPSKKAKQ